MFMVRTCDILSRSSLLVILKSIIINMPCIRSPELTHFLVESLYSLIIFSLFCSDCVINLYSSIFNCTLSCVFSVLPLSCFHLVNVFFRSKIYIQFFFIPFISLLRCRIYLLGLIFVIYFQNCSYCLLENLYNCLKIVI